MCDVISVELAHTRQTDKPSGKKERCSWRRQTVRRGWNVIDRRLETIPGVSVGSTTVCTTTIEFWHGERSNTFVEVGQWPTCERRKKGGPDSQEYDLVLDDDFASKSLT